MHCLINFNIIILKKYLYIEPRSQQMLSLIMNPHHMAMHTAPSSVGTHQLSRIFDTDDHESIYQFVHELEKFHNVFVYFKNS